jgi:hypothetical protein
MRFFGFDSFEGLPAPSGIDAADSQKDSFVRGAYSASKNYVEGWLKGLGADMGAITLVEGFFDRTLTPQLREKFRLRRCALCVIDCDLYASTKDALAFVEPLLAEGTIVLFDDWRSYANSPEAGEQRAWREFLQAHPRFKAEPFTEFHDHGMGFVVRVRSDD